ncbi:MAG: hypothetical protein GYB32_13590 [Algicola sp.]|nr:hypothetical protein [Algicola sp.]
MILRFLIIVLFCLNVSSDKEKTISWKASKKLTWEDFQGPVDSGSDAVAVTASGITFSFSVKERENVVLSFEADVSAHFYPKKSWYVKEKGDDHILAHEQLHFDITELHVRMLRYEISKLKVSNRIKSELRALHERANINLAQMQYDYDTQSENSIHKEQQAKWKAFVSAELQKFRAYRSQ